MLTATLYGYQAAGFVTGFGKSAIASANQCIADARNATPEDVRHFFRSYIRCEKSNGGYEWGWVIK